MDESSGTPAGPGAVGMPDADRDPTLQTSTSSHATAPRFIVIAEPVP
jgi:hypothetical protein